MTNDWYQSFLLGLPGDIRGLFAGMPTDPTESQGIEAAHRLLKKMKKNREGFQSNIFVENNKATQPLFAKQAGQLSTILGG